VKKKKTYTTSTHPINTFPSRHI